MSDVLSRYNTATNAYSNSVGSANEFQKSYNQQFYNDFLDESAGYKAAKAKRDAYVTAAKDKAKASVAAAITSDKEEASRVIEASGGAIGAIEAVKAIRTRVKERAAKKAANKGDQDQKGDGDAEESGDAQGTEGQTASVQTAEDHSGDVEAPSAEPDPAPVSRGGDVEMTELNSAPESSDPASVTGGGESVEANFGSLGDQPYASSGSGLTDAATGIDATGESLEASNVAATAAGNESALATYSSQLADVSEEAGTSLLSGISEAAGTAVGALADVGGAIAGSAAGEALSTVLAVAPEAAAVVGVGIGLYDLFHHHHHKQPPPDLTNAPPAPPQAPTMQVAAQGATRDLANSRAEFTTPSFDSVTDTAGSISAF